VEIEERILLIHVLYMVLPCGYTNLMGVYRFEKKHNGVNNMTVLKAKKLLAFPNLFIYYEQDMAKSVIFLDYYNNVYEGHYEKWEIMTLVEEQMNG
jgi:hypothetical protein